MNKSFMNLSFLLLSFCLLVGRPAAAFQLGDHARITREAYDEFVRCFPQFKYVNEDTLVQDDLDEDINIFRKELFYSHFYNPYKKIDLGWRSDSMGRMTELEPILASCRADHLIPNSDDLADVGYTIHHLQDMAVPPHVVPVHHSFWDGFEDYSVAAAPTSGWSCADIVAAGNEDPEQILKETAETTLQAVDNLRFKAVGEQTHKTFVFKGVDLWQESTDNSFGSYGRLGNVFGETEFSFGIENMQVNDNVYRDFKLQQMQLAVRATLRELSWVLEPGSSVHRKLMTKVISARTRQ